MSLIIILFFVHRKFKSGKFSSKMYYWIWIIIAIFVLSTSLLIGCETKGKKSLTDELYSYKTKYVGDNSKVGNIVSRLEFPKEYSYKSMEILSKEEPYGLKLYFTENEGEDFEDSIEQFKIPSTVIFSLVDNLDEITYILEKEDEEITVGTLERQYVDSITTSVLGMNTKEIGNSKGKFNELVEFYKDYSRDREKIKEKDTDKDVGLIVEDSLKILLEKEPNEDKYFYENQYEYQDILKLGNEGLEYILSEFERGNVENDLRGELMKKLAIEILDKRNNVENHDNLTPREWYGRLKIFNTVKIENDKQVFEDKYEGLVYKAYYPKDFRFIIHEDAFTAIALEVKSVLEQDNILNIYAIVSKDNVILYENGKVVKDSGFIRSTVVKYEKKDNEYILKEIVEARDGGDYGESIKEMCKDKPEMAEELINFDHNKLNKDIRHNIVEILKNNEQMKINMDEYK